MSFQLFFAAGLTLIIQLTENSRHFLVNVRLINNMSDYEKLQTVQEQSQPYCAASLQNRHSILTNQTKRKTNLAEIKRILCDIPNIDIANQLITLVTQIYMDAQYRERTNLQMREIVIKMERQIAQLRKNAPHSYPLNIEYLDFQEQLKRSEKIIRELQQKNLKLLSEVAYWQKEGYELRTELANSSVNNETEMLIEQLTLQLQQQKNRAHSMSSRVQFLEQQMMLCERELTEKAKKIRLLQLQLNKRYS